MLKGIDAQVILHRVTDYAKESAHQVRRNDLSHDQFSAAFKTQVEDQKSQVQELQKTEHMAVSREKQGGGQERQGENQKREGETAQEAVPEELLLDVGRGPKGLGGIIDISV